MNWLMAIFTAIFGQKTQKIDPADYGWMLEYEWDGLRYYEKAGGWKLYRSESGGWVLDKTPKLGPGVIQRIKKLTLAEMELCNDLTKLDNPIRTRS